MMDQWLKKPIWAFILISGFSFLVYSNSLNASFHLDDASSIINNSSIRLEDLTLPGLKKAISGNRPVTDLSFAINYYLGGFNRIGYHGVNVAIHALTGFAVYLLFLNIFGQRGAGISLFGSLLWLTHPVQTQAVTYVVQRSTSLSTLFFVLTLLFTIWGESLTKKKRYCAYVASLGFGFLAVESKEIAATLPMILLLYEYYFSCRLDWPSFRSRLYKALPLILAIIVVLGIYLKLIVFSSGGALTGLLEVFTQNYAIIEYPWWERLLTEFRVIVFYFSLLLLPIPSRLSIEHDFSLSSSLLVPMSTLFSFLTILALIVFAIRLAKVYPIASFGIFWFFITIAMESFILRLDLIFEHRLYLPSIGFILVICFLIHHLFQNKEFYYKKTLPITVFGLLVVMIVMNSVYTLQRNRVWHDELTLWKDAVQKAPNSYRAHNNLGLAYMSRDDYDQAAEEFEKAFTLAPHVFFIYDNLFRAYEHQGELDMALELVRKLIRLNPQNARAYYYLGTIMDLKGEYQKAKQALRISINLGPRKTRAYALLGNIHLKTGEIEEARTIFEGLLKQLRDRPFELKELSELAFPKFIPDKPVIHYNLGQVYEKLGHPNEAVIQYQEAIRMVPQFVPVRFDLGRLYTQQGRFDQAIEQYRKVLEYNPNVIEVHFYLAFAYEMNGNPKRAAAHYQEFLNLAPKSTSYERQRLLASEWLKKLR